jgi:hypothetical protein
MAPCPTGMCTQFLLREKQQCFHLGQRGTMTSKSAKGGRQEPTAFIVPSQATERVGSREVRPSRTACVPNAAV